MPERKNLQSDKNRKYVLVQLVTIAIILYLEYFKAAMEKRIDILKQAKENIGKAQEKQKKHYDKRHHCPDTFKVGTLVLRKDMTGYNWLQQVTLMRGSCKD